MACQPPSFIVCLSCDDVQYADGSGSNTSALHHYESCLLSSPLTNTANSVTVSLFCISQHAVRRWVRRQRVSAASLQDHHLPHPLHRLTLSAWGGGPAPPPPPPPPPYIGCLPPPPPHTLPVLLCSTLMAQVAMGQRCVTMRPLAASTPLWSSWAPSHPQALTCTATQVMTHLWAVCELCRVPADRCDHGLCRCLDVDVLQINIKTPA
jgi:hypothetical protein